MEFWKKIRKKKTMTLGALEKTTKKKTKALKLWLGRRRPQPWSFWKNQEEDHNHGVFEKTKKKTNVALGALEKTMKKETEPMGVLEKTRTIRRKPNPCFLQS